MKYQNILLKYNKLIDNNEQKDIIIPNQINDLVITNKIYYGTHSLNKNLLEKKIKIWTSSSEKSHPKIKFEKKIPQNYECYFVGVLRTISIHRLEEIYIFDDVDFPLRKKQKPKKSWCIVGDYIKKWCILE